MYTLLIISLASLFGIFYVLTREMHAVIHVKEHSVSSERLSELNRSLVRNFLVIVAKLALSGFSKALSFSVGGLSKIQSVTEFKLREIARKIAHAGHGYGERNPNASSSTFLRDLSRHKKLVAKRGK